MPFKILLEGKKRTACKKIGIYPFFADCLLYLKLFNFKQNQSFLIAACAAANLAMGTLKGEQET